MKKASISIVLSIIAIITCIINFFVFNIRVAPYEFDVYGVLVGILGILVTFLLGWQIFSVFQMKKEIDKLKDDISKEVDTEIEKLAVGIDIRTFKNTKDFFKFINYIKESGVKMDIVFIEAHEAIILGRYTLSRRAHPLKEVTLLRSILKEKKILFPIREIADLVIDTTDTKTVELEKRFKKFILAKDEDNIDVNINIHIQSFGYKYGIPTDSDLMFDVRFIPNPYYIEKLKELNGFDEEVKEYVLSQKESKEFYSKLLPLLEFLIPQYVKEGKKHLTISIGCSGGQHRSVTFVNKLAEDLKNSKVLNHINIYVSHREKELGHW